MQGVGQGRHPIWEGVHYPWIRHSVEQIAAVMWISGMSDGESEASSLVNLRKTKRDHMVSTLKQGHKNIQYYLLTFYF